MPFSVRVATLFESAALQKKTDDETGDCRNSKCLPGIALDVLIGCAGSAFGFFCYCGSRITKLCLDF